MAAPQEFIQRHVEMADSAPSCFPSQAQSSPTGEQRLTSTSGSHDDALTCKRARTTATNGNCVRCIGFDAAANLSASWIKIRKSQEVLSERDRKDPGTALIKPHWMVVILANAFFLCILHALSATSFYHMVPAVWAHVSVDKRDGSATGLIY